MMVVVLPVQAGVAVRLISHSARLLNFVEHSVWYQFIIGEANAMFVLVVLVVKGWVEHVDQRAFKFSRNDNACPSQEQRLRCVLVI